MRGEYTLILSWSKSWGELPPRARRILVAVWRYGREPGTTSACAENTKPSKTPQTHQWNYLRVRGEYQKPHLSCAFSTELPPRARRIPITLALLRNPPGTTSACAENTPRSSQCAVSRGNYLRVRGEYQGPKSRVRAAWELPPRARRIPRVPDIHGI